MLTMKDIVREGHPALRLKAEKVSFPIDQDLREKAESMLEFLKNSQDETTAEELGLRAGVGLAAPQIDINKQIIAVLLYEYDENGEVVGEDIAQIFVNPVITRHSVQMCALTEGEGCLSVDREVPGFVPRPRKITIKYQDLDGNDHEMRLSDVESIVVQHEIDHLNGIMFYDHINAERPWHKEADLILL